MDEEFAATTSQDVGPEELPAATFPGTRVRFTTQSGLPMSRLQVTADTLTMTGPFAAPTVIGRAACRAVVVQRYRRPPFAWINLLAFEYLDGTSCEYRFVALRTAAVVSALRAHGWPVEDG